MTLTSSTETLERLESLKTGIVGSIASGVAFLLLTLLHAQLVSSLPISVTSSQTLHLLISGSIALLSGFLFSVTYRYVIRQDKNPQLKSGAIMAFGLIRGLAQAENQLNNQLPLWQLGIPIAESLLLFAIVAFCVDWAIGFGWIKRME